MKLLSNGQTEKTGEIILVQQEEHYCCYTVISPYKDKDEIFSFVEIAVLSHYYNDPGLRWMLWQRLRCAWRALRGRLYMDFIELNTRADCDRLIQAITEARNTAFGEQEQGDE